jgi:hypothetical protein
VVRGRWSSNGERREAAGTARKVPERSGGRLPVSPTGAANPAMRRFQAAIHVNGAPVFAGLSSSLLYPDLRGSLPAVSCHNVVTRNRTAPMESAAKASWPDRCVQRAPRCSLHLGVSSEEFDMAHVQSLRDLRDADQRRILLAPFELADVLLAVPALFGKLLLRQTPVTPESSHISPNQRPEVHAHWLGGSRTGSLSTIVCKSLPSRRPWP